MEDEPREERFWRDDDDLRAASSRRDAGDHGRTILQVQNRREGLPRHIRRHRSLEIPLADQLANHVETEWQSADDRHVDVVARWEDADRQYERHEAKRRSD